MYGKSVEDNISILQREHIIERFTSIANDILSINKDEFPYFVFKNTSADNNVENGLKSMMTRQMNTFHAHC